MMLKKIANYFLWAPFFIVNVQAHSSQLYPDITLPVFALKTNLVYDVTTTFTLGAEFRIADRWTMDVSGNYNPWTFSNQKKMKHIGIQPELRYWLCEPFNKHFLGFHTQYASYNVGNIKLPFGIYEALKDHRFQGWLAGFGFSYGYQWYISPRWNLEWTLGVGYAYLHYEKYECGPCGNYVDSTHKHYFGPTKAGLSLIYLIR